MLQNYIQSDGFVMFILLQVLFFKRRIHNRDYRKQNQVQTGASVLEPTDKRGRVCSLLFLVLFFRVPIDYVCQRKREAA